MQLRLNGSRAHRMPAIAANFRRIPPVIGPTIVGARRLGKRDLAQAREIVATRHFGSHHEGRARSVSAPSAKPSQNTPFRAILAIYDIPLSGEIIARRSAPRPAPLRTAEETTKETPLELFGTIKQVFPSTTFAVELETGQTILAHIAGRLRRHRIKILPGDRVDLEISPYDLTKGRIVYRYRAGEARRSQA